MNTLTRLRRTEKRIVRSQRRLWLAQAAFWPGLVLTGLGVTVALGWRVMNRRGPAEVVTKSIPALVPR